MPLNNQPVGAEGSVLGATALVNLEVVVEVTGKDLKEPLKLKLELFTHNILPDFYKDTRSCVVCPRKSMYHGRVLCAQESCM